MTIATRSRARVLEPATLARLALGLSCLALALRPVAWRASITTALVGVIALAVARDGVLTRVPVARWMGVVAGGVACFAIARAVSPPIAVPFTIAAAGANTLAAIAEELLFRHAMFTVVRDRRGTAAAVAVTTIAFAAIHVPQYGWGVLPIDLAAGALLGWQRVASGTWTAPAVTHVAANLLSMG